jgi:outer membrane scaffolding protein for murein synthesis (MipA/OmpV family)
MMRRAAILLAVFATAQACAQDTVQAIADARAPTQEQAPALSRWDVGVGAGVASMPAYSGSTDRSVRALVFPVFTYRGDRFRVDGSSADLRLLRSTKLDVDLGVAGSLPAKSRAGSIRSGMPDLGVLGEIGPRMRYKFDQDTDLTVPVRAVFEARGGIHHRGFTIEPRISQSLGTVLDWRLRAYASVVLGDAAINEYFYEVAPRYATSWRPAYAAKGGLMVSRVGVFGGYAWNKDVRISAFARMDSYKGAANRDSPLLQQSGGFSAGLGITWILYRSSTLVGQ